MELDDLKKDWESAINLKQEQNILTAKTIDRMTQKKYQSKISKIKSSEIAGGIICILGLSYIGFNFNKLDTPLLKAIGILAILLLMTIPLLSFFSLTQFNSANNSDKPHIEILKLFAKQKLRFLQYQKINALLNYVLLVTVIILLPKFFYEKDISSIKSFWIYAFSLGYIFVLFFSKWVNKSYSTCLLQAEELLREIET